MKKYLLLFCFCCSLSFIKAQLPYIGTTTLIPQNPTTADFVKIVTHVSTPNLGILVDISHTVTGQQINLHGCYWQGMLTAIQNHIDTFFIGQLPAGNYQINHNVFMSATQQWCSHIDSNSTSSSFLVSGATGLPKNTPQKQLYLYPNPASSSLFINSTAQSGEVHIMDSQGVLVKRVHAIVGEAIDISGLANGLYIARFGNAEREFTTRFIKTGAE